MVRCDLTYGLLTNSSPSTLVENFLPQHRSFTVHPLHQNTSYWFTMLCTDRAGEVHTSRTLHFTTGEVPSPPPPPPGLATTHNPRVGARHSHRRVGDPTYKTESATTDWRSKFVLRARGRDRVSPHAVLGGSVLP